MESDDESEEEMTEVVVVDEGNTSKWDCESILSKSFGSLFIQQLAAVVLRHGPCHCVYFPQLYVFFPTATK